MLNTADNEILLRCDCHSADHIAFLIHDPNEDRAEHDCWYLSIVLDPDGFMRRLRLAFKYLFAPSRIRYGGCAEIVLRNEDVDGLAEFIAKRRTSKCIKRKEGDDK